jgi:hypothetical protein
MTVAYKLARLPSRISKTEPIDNVIQPHLQNPEQIFTSHARLSRCLSEMPAELPLQNPVCISCLLLFTKLEATVRDLASLRPPLPWRQIASF